MVEQKETIGMNKPHSVKNDKLLKGVIRSHNSKHGHYNEQTMVDIILHRKLVNDH